MTNRNKATELTPLPGGLAAWVGHLVHGITDDLGRVEIALGSLERFAAIDGVDASLQREVESFVAAMRKTIEEADPAIRKLRRVIEASR